MRVNVWLWWRSVTFTFVPDGDDYDDPWHVLFMWTEGNFGCDCNKSLFIQRQCDDDFPDRDCGDDIALVSLVAEDGTTLYPEPDPAAITRDSTGAWTWDSAAHPQQMPVVITQRSSGLYVVGDA